MGLALISQDFEFSSSEVVLLPLVHVLLPPLGVLSVLPPASTSPF